MNQFKPEPNYKHITPPNIGILIVNLGTPSAPTKEALKPYLKQFLNDKRVVEIPKILWWFILNGIILPFRSKKSAQKYASIWTDKGSPLQFYTAQQTQALQQKFSLEPNIKLSYAMRYNQPSIEIALEELRKHHIQHLIILPLYPQYCSSTTGSTLEEIFNIVKTWRVIPSLRTINRYHDHPHYINSLKQSVLNHWNKAAGKPNFIQGDKLIMSFHGIPHRNLELGDYYHCECHKTARLLANALELNKDDYIVSFQSRLGKAKWLQPYTDIMLEKLAKTNTQRVDVICAGFSSDCLETLEEIAMEGKATFISNGGKKFEYIPCLNDSKEGIETLYQILKQNLLGIDTPSIASISQSQQAFDNFPK